MDGVRHHREPDAVTEEEPGLHEVSEAVVQAFEALPDNFRARWELFASVAPDELAERIRDDFDDRPDERRNILTAYLGRRLGYSRYLYTTAKIEELPLWELMRSEPFGELSRDDREILWMVACTTERARQTLHPRAALAALALWRHGDIAESQRAERLLVELGLPTRLHFLYDLVRVLGRDKAEREVSADRNLLALARLHAEHGMHDVASLLGGLLFVRRFDPWYTGGPRRNLERACARAAAEHPFEYADWIELMAESAVAGELTSSWLEPILRAAIRICVDDAEAQARYRLFDSRKLYEASPKRLRELYEMRLRRLRANQTDALTDLLSEVDQTAIDNPFRAMRLMELIVETVGRRPLPQLLRELAELEPLTERLLVLYVRCLHLDAVAVRFVREHRDEVKWERWVGVTSRDVDTFLLVGDYEATFGARNASLLGVGVVHLDKDAAARVRYFQTSRTNPNSVAKALKDFDLPRALPITRIAESRLVDELTRDFAELFAERAGAMDLRERVLDDLHRVGVRVDRWEDIGQLPIAKIEQALLRGRQRDLLVGAVSGGLAGALAPRTAGVSAVMDVPFLMGLIADTCARHCWYYGFDPREHPDLATRILAVALGGVRAASWDREEAQSALKGYLVRRSVLLAAIGQGAVAQIASPTIAMLYKELGGLHSRPPLLVAAMERVMRRETRPSLVRRLSRFVLPVADGFLGTVFNVSLVYDLGDAAQAVLADRFLARKYHDWEGKL